MYENDKILTGWGFRLCRFFTAVPFRNCRKYRNGNSARTRRRKVKVEKIVSILFMPNAGTNGVNLLA